MAMPATVLARPASRRDVGELSVPVVPPQVQRRSDDQIEIAVVIHIHPRGGAGPQRLRRQPRGRGHVLERAVGALVHEHTASRSQHEQVRSPVVVVVAGHRSHALYAFRRRQVRSRGDVGKPATVVSKEMLSAGAGGEQIQVAVVVDVEEDRAGRA